MLKSNTNKLPQRFYLQNKGIELILLTLTTTVYPV
jgi:hypothetical protein